MVKDKLWLEEHNPTNKPPRERRDPPNKKQISIGSMFVGYDPVYRPSYGAEARDDYKQAQLFKGMHYTVEPDVRVNGKIKNAGGFKGSEIFGKQTKGGIVGGYSNNMKALFHFVLLCCGHANEFEEFLDENEKVQGIEALIRGLKSIASRTPDTEGSDKGAEAEEDDCSELFVSEGISKKRGRDEVVDEDSVDKRARAG
jgi:hypothetical protein